ncbi:hypothetical protein OH76DRAFT_1469935 [Lentinus brumalis]|uniref:BTB domain-containing protein n=1 Tax=Lentinus brumalis TaxID=2498619 RepID=A0A371DLQ1_9APHY|nr:hypothetical protein OH76DRAFT_1469935 [Polyporus brumalis]
MSAVGEQGRRSLEGGALIKDKELWFDDGNIIILASKRHAFRVYKGLLFRASSNIQGYVEGCTEDTKPIDGCPVVSFEHDSPTDMRHFLHALLLSATCALKQASLPFATIASVIRIAHKYEADKLVDAALSRLESFLVPRPGHWTESAAAWEERRDLGQAQCGISFEPRDAISAVKIAIGVVKDGDSESQKLLRRSFWLQNRALARIAILAPPLDVVVYDHIEGLTGADWVLHKGVSSLKNRKIGGLRIVPESRQNRVSRWGGQSRMLLDKPLMLPLAFYECCLLEDVLSLRNGVGRLGEEDGTLDKLNDTNYRRCILAMPLLSRQVHASVLRVLEAGMTGPATHCRLGGNCKELTRHMFMSHTKDDGPSPLHDLFVRLDRRTPPPPAFLAREGALCQPCLDRLLSLSEEDCAAMRRRLPEFFGLGDLEGWQ